MLWRSPGFAVAALVCLGLGIGLNATIFSLFDALVLHPYGYDTERLVSVMPAFRRQPPLPLLSGPEFEAIRTGVKSFESVAAYDVGNWNLGGVGVPERLVVVWVSPGLFETYGVTPVLGRGFLPEDRNARTVIVSHRLWQNRFGADPKLAGAIIRLNGAPWTVAGILPPRFLLGFAGLGGADLYVPFAGNFATMPRSFRELPVVGRLRPGASIETARAELDVIAAQLERDHVSETREYAGWKLRAEPLAESGDPATRTALTVLLIAVALVLLIACVNVSNLILARAASRTREVAIRVALGASRWRLLRQFLAEGLVLSAAGAACGIVLAAWGVDLILSVLPRQMEVLPPGTIVSVNARVLAAIAGAAALIALVFAAAPALRPGKRGLGSALVVVEVALSLVLLAGTALVLRSYGNVTGVDPGLDPDGVLVMRTTLPRAKYQGPAVTAFFERLEQRVAAIPGVASAGLTNQLPLRGFAAANVTSDYPDPDAEPVRAESTIATSDYFRAVRIPLRRGRLFEPADKAPAILNERAAARLFPNADPIGRRIRLGSGQPWLSVVGIVGDTRNQGLEQPPEPEVFVPVANDRGNWNQLWLVVRAAGEPAAMFRAIREAVREMDPDQPIYLTMTLREMIGFTLLRRTAAAWLLSVFGAVALLLATVGLYGVVAYSVARRTREIGIRMAVGATRADVMRLVLGHGMRLALAGVAAGAVVAALSTRFASTLLFNVSPTDPLAFAATAALLLATTLLASYLPARRSAKVDPNVALRYE